MWCGSNDRSHVKSVEGKIKGGGTAARGAPFVAPLRGGTRCVPTVLRTSTSRCRERHSCVPCARACAAVFWSAAMAGRDGDAFRPRLAARRAEARRVGKEGG